jgi:hypothetical protein
MRFLFKGTRVRPTNNPDTSRHVRRGHTRGALGADWQQLEGVEVTNVSQLGVQPRISAS